MPTAAPPPNGKQSKSLETMVEEHAIAIDRLQGELNRKTAELVIALGREASAAQEKFEKAKRSEGAFRDWIKHRLKVSRQQGYRWIYAYQRFKDFDCNKLLHFGRSALYALSEPKTPPAIVERAKERATRGETVTHKWVQQQLESEKTPKAPLELSDHQAAIVNIWQPTPLSGKHLRDPVRRHAEGRKIERVMRERPERTRPSVFLDSGSYTLHTKEAKAYAEKHQTSESAYYDTADFFQYMDDYLRFIKQYEDPIDLYSNLDVIGNPDLSLRNFTYMREEGLKPVPVLHYGTTQWELEGMVYDSDNLALGGLVGHTHKDGFEEWITDCFREIKEFREMGYPCRVHGFGLTSFELMRKYPWDSVDSTSWLAFGMRGNLRVPQHNGSEFVFDQPANEVRVSEEDSETEAPEPTPDQLERAKAWVQECGLEWDQVVDPKAGYKGRHRANLLYYERLQEVKGIPRIYYSGPCGGGTNPEELLGTLRGGIMPSFHDLRRTTQNRMDRLFR